MNSPYDMEYSLAFSFLVEKNDTVSGIIGKTQGVSSAKKPPNRPSIKILSLRVKLLSISATYSFSKSSEFPKSSFRSLTNNCRIVK